MARNSNNRSNREIRERGDSVVALLQAVAQNVKARRLGDSSSTRPVQALTTQDRAWIHRNLKKIWGGQD
jgi:hypothetical protein